MSSKPSWRGTGWASEQKSLASEEASYSGFWDRDD
jgi:hypothetical protein